MTLQKVECARAQQTLERGRRPRVALLLRVATGVALVLSCLGVLAPAIAQAGEPCPNQRVRELQTHGLSLPDCRAYEQVSPSEKGNGQAEGKPGSVQASPDGAAIHYYSLNPFPAGQSPFIGSTPRPGEWSTQSALPAGAEPETAGVEGFAEDLSTVLLASSVPLTPEAPAGASGLFYLRDVTGGGLAQLPFAFFGGASSTSGNYFTFDAASAGGTRIFFESREPLLSTESHKPLFPSAAAGVVNLYEWDRETGRLGLAGVLSDGECEALSLPPGCAPPHGSVAGAGGGAIETGIETEHYVQSAISTDGSTVFFTANGVDDTAPGPEQYRGQNGRIYARLNGESTIPVSAGAEARFRAATPDGRYAFYTEPAQSGDLYRFDTETDEREELASGSQAGVLGLLGVSEDGSTVYFAATGVLAANRGPTGEEAVESTQIANLYAWRQVAGSSPATTFIAELSSNGSFGDEGDWRDFVLSSGGQDERNARIAADGATLLFASDLPLTGYDNRASKAGACTEHSGACQELFRYRSGPEGALGTLVCVSCDPNGTEAISNAFLSESIGGGGGTPRPILTRNLSANGNRVFFDTADSLVQATTGSNVYEWETDGEGSCRSNTQDDGCLSLISTGTSPSPSYFGDASANGEDVFFFTNQALALTDTDQSYDLYDARVDGGPPPAEECNDNPAAGACKPAFCEGEGCLETIGSSPAFGLPSSITLAGTGNLAPPPTQGMTGKVLTTTQKLARALRSCRAKHNRRKRTSCEAQARKRYSTKAKKKSGSGSKKASSSRRSRSA